MKYSEPLHTIGKGLWRSWIILLVIFVTGWNLSPLLLVHAATNTLYSSEFIFDYDPEESAWVIDRFNDVAGDLELRFGNIPSQSIKFDVSNSWFEFGSSINLQQNELKNAVLDNRATPPESPVEGQIYHNTTDQQTYVWDGTTWLNMSATTHTQNTDTGTTANTFTLDADNNGGDTSIHFGGLTGKSLRWDITNDRFALNDALRIEGNTGIVGQAFIADNHSDSDSDGFLNMGRIDNVWQTIQFNAVSGLFEISKGLSVGGDIAAQGNTFTLDADNTGAGQNVSIIANQGTANDGTLRYNATSKQWEISNDGGTYVSLANGGPQGPAGYTTLFAQTAATTSACPAGGYVFTSGLDTNQNSILDANEVATTATVCNGTNGSGGGNGNSNSGGGNTLAGTCVVTRTASYSQSAQYSIALSNMVSYTDNNLEMVLQNGVHVSSIGNNNGGSSNWSNPNYLLSILGSAQNLMVYLNYNGTPPAGQTPYVTTAKITKFGNTLNCSVVNL